jgi:Zn-dependent protease
VPIGGCAQSVEFTSVFRLFGFDVRVRLGFILFVGLIAFINPGPLGLWLAAALAVFTLLHELGHAVAARSAGAEAAISLDFMAGYTSFRPTRPISKARRALISVSGPAVQIVASLAVLAAMGVNPLSSDSVRESEATIAIWWAGPVIGLLNLIPVLPLDGGHLAQVGVESVLRRPALREMAIASVVITIAGAVATSVLGQPGFVIFVAFLLISQLQLLQATSPKRRGLASKPPTWGVDGVTLLPGTRPSPWQLAYQSVLAGDPNRAQRIIIEDLVRPSSLNGRPWAPPSDAPLEALRAVVHTLPQELPPGNPYSETVLAQILLVTGETKRAGEYAADRFVEHRTPLMATVVARAAARLGDPGNAMLWVQAAADAAEDATDNERAAVAHVLDNAPELVALSDRSGFREARTMLN